MFIFLINLLTHTQFENDNLEEKIDEADKMKEK